MNREIPAVQPLRQTIGDECQALYTTLSAAITATLLLRLALHGEIDLRFGIGWGHLDVYEPASAPYAQDGPTWWAAREAITEVAEAPHQREWPRGVRTRFVRWAGPWRARPPWASAGWEQLRLPGMDIELPEPAAFPLVSDELVNAFLMCRDELVSGMDARDARLCLAAFRGERQADMAAREGISQPAVAQRLMKSGAYAVLRASAELQGWQPWSL